MVTTLREWTRTGGKGALRSLASGRGERARLRRQQAVDLLVSGVKTVADAAPVAERVELYTEADHKLAPRRRDASIGKELKDHLAGMLIVLAHGLPTPGAELTRSQHKMLEEVVELCERIANGPAANNEYWRCIVLSLRAEYLALLNVGVELDEDAQTAFDKKVRAILSASQAAYELIPEPRDLATDRYLYNSSALSGSTQQFGATLAYVHKLIAEVNTH